ncbi:acyl-ACP--UDP-N-acetylglucosamine O-acyltransferase [Amaricoccus sp.]|uniref:acyl-ACP--UDP-N-acetylglucosamine O-acyltransferase n=1 Tax=Amaricoccus sp. TaxID=1872485 RepID=UPI001B3E70B9|nr:acyl-ACP--UDP-N-acetylglucosamine O-acyltransferase [Amaricoccus sp.]MBP7001588.1 acyl-ACP--UDP-N-acetylglucosamine O-acyltransferase [Amaricoccus sp.]
MPIDPSAEIHPTAVVEEGARIGAGCRIGPYCVIGPEATLGAGLRLHSHVVISGVTTIGDGTEIWPFASIGSAPQDLKFRGERTELVIGARNRIREYATLNPGTEGGGGITRVGDDNLLMMSIHVGHDCQIGNHVILVNNATLSGHVILEDNVILGGLSAVHQFCRIGRGAMIGGMSGVTADVIPYGMVIGNRGRLAGLNLVGLKRRGAERAAIHGLRAAYAEIFEAKDGGTLQERAAAVAAARADNDLVREVADFIAADSSRSFTIPEG